ncbi:TetR/AcrR family transcriptional regulator [Bacillus sp. FJAT-18017]|uniref:TetR/AcrR family transcriptional regulator n=1 Tax=Bacillus sp. FJAT-18017 TaxID=1705566 RepID=UPI000AE90F29|nr:TetR/AcrR family transcriptional regulator [Bacillus sp. FJAT-18017]
MEELKTDPRILRTRKLIMDSFIELSGKKDFKDITIKDLTTEAMINRATFYYHFEDKYDLLEKVLSEVLQIKLNDKDFTDKELDEAALVSMFLAITNFQMTLSNRCHAGYQDTIARIIREQIEIILYNMLAKKHSTKTESELKLTAAMLSWGLYGASVEWKRNSELPPEEFIKLAAPTILNKL